MFLSVRTGPDEGTTVEIEGDSFVLGRQHGCDLVVRDSRSSRRHAEIVRLSDGGYRLRDLGSANGTSVDGAQVEEAVLVGGEEIRIGDVIIEVRRGPGDEDVATPSARPQTSSSFGSAKTPTPSLSGRPRRGESPSLIQRLRHPRSSSGQPEAVTHSMVRRLIDTSTRRTRRMAIASSVVAGLAILTLAALLFTGALEGDDDRVPEIVSRLEPSTALVITSLGGTATGTGSGWVLDAREGLIVTNAHVVNQGEQFRVVVGGRDREATVVSAAPCEDLALLKVEDTAGLRAAPVGTGADVKKGETVVALGFGMGSRPADPVGSTRGVVSVVRAAFREPAPDVPAYPDVVQTDTALNPGNSGGPLVDLEGRVIGVNSAARTEAGGRPLQNVNYAIAIDRARGVLAQMRAGRAPGWTGLIFEYPDDDELEGLPPHLRVKGAIAGTPAAAADLEPGTLIAGVDGRPLESPSVSALCGLLADRRAGDEVTLEVVQEGRDVTRAVPIRLAG